MLMGYAILDFIRTLHILLEIGRNTIQCSFSSSVTSILAECGHVHNAAAGDAILSTSPDCVEA